ncbi:MAG: hypothetical protein DRZ82_09280 [Thermoprotei archaeon]|nr:MAG: hypothetical protein DRZ82_09280 [Thermoprotei archaeon]
MPVADTELLFLLNPKDPRYKHALRILDELGSTLLVPDVALMEFEITLRSRNIEWEKVRKALLAIRGILDDYGIMEVKTIDSLMLIRHIELMENYGLSYFDSLIAASALKIDNTIVSDDKDFDKVRGLKRIPITKT